MKASHYLMIMVALIIAAVVVKFNTCESQYGSEICEVPE